MPAKRREAGGLEKTDKCGQDVGETTERGEGEQERGFENGGLFSHRVHSVYQEFLAVVQGNLEGIAPVLRITRTTRNVRLPCTAAVQRAT